MAAKVIGSDSLNWAAGQLMQLLGGRGYMENNIAPQLLRDARVLSVGEGPNEPLTIQVGRKARHTDAIGSYLDSNRDGTEVNAALAEALPEIVDRCLSQPGPFADRATAQLWAESLIGRVTCEALLLAAVRTRAAAPHYPWLRAVNWPGRRSALASALRRAQLTAPPRNELIPTVGEADALVAHYANAIGDVEQTLAGEEEELDIYLCRAPGSNPCSPSEHLPGHAEFRDPRAGGRRARCHTSGTEQHCNDAGQTVNCWPKCSAVGSRQPATGPDGPRHDGGQDRRAQDRPPPVYRRSR